MEAVALYDCPGNAVDELPFKKGTILKIFTIDVSKNWLKAEQNGKEGIIPNNYIQMKPHAFVRDLRKEEAENVLLHRNEQGEHEQKDGAFIIAPSESTAGDFSLSVKDGDQVQHFKVLRDGAGKYFLWVVKFNSLNQLVEYHRAASVSRVQTIHLCDLEEPSSAPHRVIAGWDFASQTEDELAFDKGEIIRVVDDKAEWWWMGEISRDDKVYRGSFPKTYVSPFSG